MATGTTATTKGPTKYWLSFRLDDAGPGRATYAQRYSEFKSWVTHHHDGPPKLTWEETTSYILFSSNDDIADIAGHLKSVLMKPDTFLLGKVEYQRTFAFGVVDRTTLGEYFGTNHLTYI